MTLEPELAKMASTHRMAALKTSKRKGMTTEDEAAEERFSQHLQKSNRILYVRNIPMQSTCVVRTVF